MDSRGTESTEEADLFEWPPAGESPHAAREQTLSYAGPPALSSPIATGRATGGEERRPGLSTIALGAVALIAAAEAAFIISTWRAQPAADAQRHSGSAAHTGQQHRDAQSSPQIASAGADGRRHAGQLVIRSEPSGASVSVDGRDYGVTPLTVSDLAPGEHRVRLKRDGAEVRETVRIEPGATVSLVAPMGSPALPSGWISIASPVHFDIYQAGTLVGNSRAPKVMLAAGAHQLRLVSEVVGYDESHAVRIPAGGVAHLSVPLPEVEVNLNATPWAMVWIDGRFVGETPIGRLPVAVGPHEVIFRHPELGEKRLATVIRAGGPARLSADLTRPP